ncbi:MAG: hypothetical protein JRE64_01945 [Deltaproteobacteria bacterium]|nr:hypothetical protein [Deltaproteobacteria bacterium]
MVRLLRGKEDTKAKLDEVSDKTDVASVSMFRNIVAHACFGTEEKEKFIVDPFGSNDFPSYGAIDKLRSLDDDAPNKITDCDVPIAIIRWTEQKIKFVDLWSVRRRPYELTPSNRWPTIASSRRLAEAEAMFFQFQDQVLALIKNQLSFTEATVMEAVDYFQYLPALGFLPLQQNSHRGVNIDNFFNRQPNRTMEFISGEIIMQLVCEAMNYHPIETSEKELVWIYQIWQHTKAIDKGEDNDPYILFTSGHVPYKASARFDVARWDYSNYTRSRARLNYEI